MGAGGGGAAAAGRGGGGPLLSASAAAAARRPSAAAAAAAARPAAAAFFAAARTGRELERRARSAARRPPAAGGAGGTGGAAGAGGGRRGGRRRRRGRGRRRGGAGAAGGAAAPRRARIMPPKASMIAFAGHEGVELAALAQRPARRPTRSPKAPRGSSRPWQAPWTGVLPRFGEAAPRAGRLRVLRARRSKCASRGRPPPRAAAAAAAPAAMGGGGGARGRRWWGRRHGRGGRRRGGGAALGCCRRRFRRGEFCRGGTRALCGAQAWPQAAAGERARATTSATNAWSLLAGGPRGIGDRARCETDGCVVLPCLPSSVDTQCPRSPSRFGALQGRGLKPSPDDQRRVGGSRRWTRTRDAAALCKNAQDASRGPEAAPSPQRTRPCRASAPAACWAPPARRPMARSAPKRDSSARPRSSVWIRGSTRGRRVADDAGSARGTARGRATVLREAGRTRSPEQTAP